MVRKYFLKLNRNSSFKKSSDYKNQFHTWVHCVLLSLFRFSKEILKSKKSTVWNTHSPFYMRCSQTMLQKCQLFVCDGLIHCWRNECTASKWIASDGFFGVCFESWNWYSCDVGWLRFEINISPQNMSWNDDSSCSTEIPCGNSPDISLKHRLPAIEPFS